MTRMMDMAWIRDGNVIHTDEAMVLAMLLHTDRKTQRSKRNVEEIMEIMNG